MGGWALVRTSSPWELRAGGVRLGFKTTWYKYNRNRDTAAAVIRVQ